MKRVLSLKKKEAAPSGLSDCYRPCPVKQSERSVSLNDTGCGLNLNQEFFSKKQMPKRINPLLLKNACISEIDEQSSEKCDDSSMECLSTRLPDYIRRLQVQIEEELSENTKIISEIQCLFHSENRRNEDLDYVLSKISLNFGKFFPPILLSKLSSYIDDRKNIENVFNTYQSFIFKMTDLAKQKLEKKSKHSLTYQKNIPVTDLDVEEKSEFILKESSKKEIEISLEASSQFEEYNDAQRLLSALDKTKKM